MNRRRWTDPPGATDFVPGGTSSVLVSFHYLRSALRRRWRVWAGLGVAGFVLGLLATVVLPASSAGSTTVILEHDPAVEPSLAMATDLRLLGTRTVAERAIDELGLDLAPDEFQDTVKAEPLTADVLTIAVYADDRAEAVERTRVLTETFMEFRSEQIAAQSDALVEGYEERIAALERQSERLTQQFETVSASPRDDRAQGTELLGQRAQAQQQIGEIQQQIADAELQSGSIIEASQVLDEASLVPQSPLRRTVLAGLSGLIGGTAIGMGIVLAVAITSDRLRRREDVSRALGAPVRSGVRGIRASRWAPWRRDDARRALEVAVHSLEHALQGIAERPVRLAVAAVDNVEDAAVLLGALALHLTDRDVPVFLVDLSRSGRLEAALDDLVEAESAPPSPERPRPTIYRSEETAELARGPLDTVSGLPGDLSAADPRREQWGRAEIVLTLVEVAPERGLDALSSWADIAVPIVTGGASSAQRLETTAEMLRDAGLRLPFAVMVGCDPTDDSIGSEARAEEDAPAERRTG